MSSKKKSQQNRSRASLTPQKGGRSRTGSPQWISCDSCDALSPPAAAAGACCRAASGYVRNGVLYGSDWHQDGPAERQAPAGWCRALCYLRPSAAAALRARVGDRLLVSSGDRSAVCRLWPCSGAGEVAPASVGVSPATAARLEPMDPAAVVVPLSGVVAPAGSVLLAPTAALPFSVQSAPFVAQVARELRGLVLAVGHRYCTSFMGTPVVLTVTDVRRADEGDDLACRMSQLSVASPQSAAAGDASQDEQSSASPALSSPAGFHSALASTPKPRGRRSSPTLPKNSARLPQGLVEIVADTEIKVQASQEENSKPASAVPRLGGLDETLTYLRSMIDQVFATWRPDAEPEVLELPRGVLLFGPSGTGKTSLATVLAAQYGDRFHLIRGAQLQSRYHGGTEEKLRELFDAALRRRPAVVFIDNVESVAGRVDGERGGSDRQRRLLACLLSLLDAAAGVALVAATAKPAGLDPAVRRAGRLDRELELPVPGPAARAEILSLMLPTYPPEQLSAVATAAHGYVGADLQAVVSEARLLAATEENREATPTLDHLQAALQRVKPSAMREVLVEVADVRWSDIGGQHALKLRLKQAVEWPIRYPDAFKRMGVSPPKGVLMYGPPGCSKTMIAKALATESGLNFISIKGPELFSKWVGESERAVREVFRRARQSAPAIVFFDELDALAVRRGDAGGGAHSVAERVLAQLLTEMDGVSALCDVTIVAATNRPDLIDAALLRPGRLDHVVHVPLPDAETRTEIFRLRLRSMPADGAVTPEWLAERTEGYSGAEVTAVCHEAALLALEGDVEAEVVSKQDFERALDTVQPRVTEYDQVYRQFAQEHRKNR